MLKSPNKHRLRVSPGKEKIGLFHKLTGVPLLKFLGISKDSPNVDNNKRPRYSPKKKRGGNKRKTKRKTKKK